MHRQFAFLSLHQLIPSSILGVLEHFVCVLLKFYDDSFVMNEGVLSLEYAFRLCYPATYFQVR
jgi:hypothetical protein